MTDHRPYRPSNGTEGEIFYGRWCAWCERDREYRDGGQGDPCPILTATYALSVNDPDYPREWREDGPRGPRCTAYCSADSFFEPFDPTAAIGLLL